MINDIPVLRRARELINTGWTQQVAARDASGHAVGNFDPSATCFCLIGSIARARSDLGISVLDHDADHAVYTTLSLEGGRSIVDFNDHPARTKEDVVGLIDRTIERISPASAQA